MTRAPLGASGDRGACRGAAGKAGAEHAGTGLLGLRSAVVRCRRTTEAFQRQKQKRRCPRWIREQRLGAGVRKVYAVTVNPVASRWTPSLSLVFYSWHCLTAWQLLLRETPANQISPETFRAGNCGWIPFLSRVKLSWKREKVGGGYCGGVVVMFHDPVSLRKVFLPGLKGQGSGDCLEGQIEAREAQLAATTLRVVDHGEHRAEISHQRGTVGERITAVMV